jgi:hypothetical protein
MRIFELHTSKARYELKVVPLALWRVNVKTIRGFIHIPLADLPHINLRETPPIFSNLTIMRAKTVLVGRVEGRLGTACGAE